MQLFKYKMETKLHRNMADTSYMYFLKTVLQLNNKTHKHYVNSKGQSIKSKMLHANDPSSFLCRYCSL